MLRLYQKSVRQNEILKEIRDELDSSDFGAVDGANGETGTDPSFQAGNPSNLITSEHNYIAESKWDVYFLRTLNFDGWHVFPVQKQNTRKFRKSRGKRLR